jgi:hypothetical protein
LKDIVLDDGILAGKALFPDALKDLYRGIGMGFEQADNIPFEGVEFAGAWSALAGFELRFGEPLSDSPDIHNQFLGNLLGRQSVVLR